MTPKFELDSTFHSEENFLLVDPDAYDASEQQFAASVEGKSAASFVVDAAESIPIRAEGSERKTLEAVSKEADHDRQESSNSEEKSYPTPGPPVVLSEPQTDLWRREVAARVQHYRTRKPRAPKYPSLLLKFDPPTYIDSGASFPAEGREDAVPCASKLSVIRGSEARQLVPETTELSGAPAELHDVAQDLAQAEPTARILEFPRSAPIVPPIDELAEPIFDRPRILEVPESSPPPPALGGISIEATQQPEPPKRLGFELPLQPAPRARRLLAAVVDLVIVLAAFAIFGTIFWKITTATLPLLLAAEFSAGLLAVLWGVYQYCLVVYSGTTPGLMAAKLRLSGFDGTAVSRRMRRWRVVASLLSGASLALGYAWYFLDEDRLCWHDRITHTYMAPK
jgi:hypothetical protein